LDKTGLQHLKNNSCDESGQR